jgi:hypothetical protein
MKFSFYPNHEYGCELVGRCPHVGGASLGTVVLAASENDDFLRYLHGTIDFERQRNTELFAEVQRLEKELEQVQLELKLERQNKFATNKQKQADAESKPVAAPSKPASKKRGAPVGHPGWRRPTP